MQNFDDFLEQFSEVQLMQMFDAMFDSKVAESLIGTDLECVLYDTYIQGYLYRHFNPKLGNKD